MLTFSAGVFTRAMQLVNVLQLTRWSFSSGMPRMRGNEPCATSCGASIRLQVGNGRRIARRLFRTTQLLCTGSHLQGLVKTRCFVHVDGAGMEKRLSSSATTSPGIPEGLQLPFKTRLLTQI
eukprot:6181946-Pleurochrysis_carterae.AAC.6